MIDRGKGGIALLVLLAAGVPAPGDVDVSLRPRAAPQPAAGYARACLRIADPNGELPGVAAAAAVRWVAGGPTHIHPVTVAPGATQETTLALPAQRLRQAYTVRLLAADRPGAEQLLSRRCVVRWGEHVAAAAPPMVDAEAYRRWDAERAAPAWPVAFRLRTLVVALVVAVALAAVLLTRRPAVRAALFALAVAGGTAGVAWSVRGPVVEESRFAYTPRGQLGTTRPGRSELLAVTARRTTTWSRPRADVAPVYPTPAALAADATVIHAGRGVRAELPAGAVRLFRRR